MRWSNVVASQDEAQWFEDYVKLALATPVPTLPPRSQKIGKTTVTWFETEPGVAFLTHSGGSLEDRVLAAQIISTRLALHGIRRAHFSFDNRHVEGFTKTADWDDIEAKAVRLIRSGQVQVTRNGLNNVVGTVQGDHGTYQTEIWRDDPNSDAITMWQCDCPWDQYAWQRTRQWKKYEGRCCSHALALYWAARSLPLDEDAHPANGGGAPQQPSLFNMPGASPAGPVQSPYRAPTPPPQGQQQMIPGMFPGQATGTPPMPSGPDIIPPYPMDPSLLPQVNPASVPGLRQPSPTNPTQYPGGTFSKVATDEWDFSDQSEQGGHKWVYNTQTGRGAVVNHDQYHDDAANQAGITWDNTKDWEKQVSHSGTITPDGIIDINFGFGERDHPDVLNFLRQHVPSARFPVTQDEADRAYEHAWRIAAQQYTNGQMVSTKHDDWGEWVGRSVDHGAGSPAKIPAGSPGEVLGTEPATGMVQVLFMNQAIGVQEHGNFEPWGATCWYWPTDIYPSPQHIRPPGPAIQRRR